MKTIKHFFYASAIVFGLSACSSDDDNLLEVEAHTVTNLHAPQTSNYMTNPPTISGDFVMFDFGSGETTTDTADWDIAFRGTTILVNGGSSTGIAEEPARNGNAAAYVTDSTFDELTEVNNSFFAQDSASGPAIQTGSGNGWYTYNPMTHIISPAAGKILVIRTADDKYAKVEILSYYHDSDTANDGEHYTFNYVYQPNDGETSFQ